MALVRLENVRGSSAARESPVEVDPAVELGRERSGHPVKRANERLWRRTRDFSRSAHNADDANALRRVAKHRCGKGVDAEPHLIDGLFEEPLADEVRLGINALSAPV